MFAVESEPLETLVRAVGDDDEGFVAARVDPDAVGGVERAVSGLVAFGGFAEAAHPVAVGVVAVHAEAAVAVGEVEAAVGKEGEVGGVKAVTAPGVVVWISRLELLAGGVARRFHGGELLPNDLARRSQFGEGTLAL